MPKLVIAVLALLFAGSLAYSQAPVHHASSSNGVVSPTDVPSMPSEEEIGELLGKTSEYVNTYQQTLSSTKYSLDKAATPGFYEKGMELSKHAIDVIDAIKKNGTSAYSLVALIGILDDMSLNAARASAAATLVALKEDRTDPKNHAMDDFVSLAQAEKNCYDISELLLHATLRYISVEETALRVLLDKQKP